MATIKAFRGYRPAKGYEDKVPSKPYDVLNTEEARAEAEGNPYSFLHIVKPQIDLPDGINEYNPEVYAKARENFYELLEQEILVQDEEPFVYVYQQQMDDHIQAGIVACSSVEDYFNDVIKKHEYTRVTKEKDRINHIKTSGIHAGPVFLTYPDVSDITQIVDEVRRETPDMAFTADDGVKHTLWVVRNTDKIFELEKLFSEKVPYTYIADGHHRAASSAKVGQLLAEDNPDHTGEESYNYFLSVLFPASELKVIDYNRVVKDLNGLSEEDFTKKIEEKFDVTVKGPSTFRPVKMHEFSMYLNGAWYQLTPKAGTYNENDPVNRLDAAILQNNLLNPVLGIEDPRKDERIDFVGGIRGLGELEKRVNSGEMAVAFALFPVTIEQLISVADGGQVMPPKSTWFEPKLRSGVVVHKFKD